MFGLNESTQYISSKYHNFTIVQLKSVVTRLSKGADCSQQTC